MLYQEKLPNKPLQDIIQNYWKFEVKHNPKLQYPIPHETLPENSMSLVFINQPYFSGIRFMAPHTSKYSQSLMPESIFVGIKFQPWIAIPSLISNKASAVNTTFDVPKNISLQLNDFDIKSVPAPQLFDILESQTISLLNNLSIEKNDMVKFICISLDKGIPISDIVSEIPASTRVIQKKFKHITGITMKQYATISRQRNTWKSIVLESKSHIEAILDHGYFDQSHFINEFKKLMSRSHKDFQSYLASVDIRFH